jgi:hypothetical protein
MEMTGREWFGIIHGMGLGAVFLLAFAGGLAGLYTLRPTLVTNIGLIDKVRRLRIGTTVMAVVAWLTVISGTWVVYIWYRAPLPKGGNLADYPKASLLASPTTEGWHEFGMEFKEHIAWVSPILATAVAFVVIFYGPVLAKNKFLRYATIGMFVVAFATAAIAGIFGALITKAAPV